MAFKKHDFSYRTVRDFVEGESVFITIPIGQNLFHQKIILDGNVVVSGGSTTGNCIAENPYGLIQRVIVHAVKRGDSFYPDGELKNLTSRSLARRRVTDKGEFISDFATPAGIDGTAKTTPLHTEIMLRYALPTLERPSDTSLPTHQFKSITLEIVCGGRDSLYEGNDRDWNFDGLKIYYEDQREDMAGDSFVLFETDTYIPINGENPEMPIENLPPGWNYLDALVFTTSSKVLVDTILEKLEIRRGSENWYKRTKLEMKSDNYELANVRAGQATTGLFYLPINGASGRLYGAQPVVTAQDMALVASVKNPGGAGKDGITINLRRVAFPENFIPVAAKK